MKRIDVGAVRERFPIFEKQVYINSCSQGALSLDVKQAYEQYLCDWDERGAPWDYWVERAETTRKSIATLLNAHPDEVAVSNLGSEWVSGRARRRLCSCSRTTVRH